MSLQSFTDAPAATTCRLVPFETASIAESIPPRLVVRGTAPCLNMEVSLQPRIYIDCPDHWGIEVVGCLPGAVCLRATQPYTVSISLEGIIGSKGIEVIGADRTERIDLSGGCKGALQCDVAMDG